MPHNRAVSYNLTAPSDGYAALLGSDSSDTDDDEPVAEQPLQRGPSFKLKLPTDSNLQMQQGTQYAELC